MRQPLFSKVSLLCLLILTMLAFYPGRVVATSWVRLQPDEVINRAEIIVQGTYDFNVQPNTPYNRMWVPFKFNVEKYYKGSGNAVIEASIEQSDVGWVKQFQEQKGSFILFLQRDEKSSNLLIPVGGPNGMIQVQDGSFQNMDSAYSQRYKDFLAKQFQTTPSAEKPIQLTKESITSKVWPWFLTLFTLGVGGLLLVKLPQRKR